MRRLGALEFLRLRAGNEHMLCTTGSSISIFDYNYNYNDNDNYNDNYK